MGRAAVYCEVPFFKVALHIKFPQVKNSENVIGYREIYIKSNKKRKIIPHQTNLFSKLIWYKSVLINNS